METEKITTSPSDNKVYMHTEAEMEDIIEGLVLLEICHEILKNGDLKETLRAFFAAALDLVVGTLIEKLAGDDVEKIAEKIREKHNEAETMDPMELLKGLN